MTREEARKAAEVMMAYAEGREIEFSSVKNNHWEEASYPTFDWYHSKYRAKPEPKYRPFKNSEECWNEMQKHYPFGWIEIKGTKLHTQIIAVDETTVVIPNSIIKFNTAFRDFMFQDGTPFGIQED